MNYRKYKLPLIVLLLTTMLAVSCKDEWDNHYNIEMTGKSALNLNDYIHSQADLSTFAQMLSISGYDSVLSKSQAYTVWAPTNTALAGVSLSDKELVTKLVQNHITQFSLPTGSITSKQLTMLDRKLLMYEKTNSGYSFGGKPLAIANLATSNGIVHVINQYVPYRKNVWEYITTATGIDSLRNYCNSLTIKEFDKTASYKDEVLIDSVFKYTNKYTTNLGDLATEDSIYTAILPNDAAWNEAYSRILPFYKTLPVDGRSAAQIVNTKWTMVRDCMFRGVISNPYPKDTVYSTSHHKISNINELINGAEAVEISNGAAYIANQLKFKPVDSWFRELRVEAETATNRTNLFSTVTSLSSIGTTFGVSGKNYIKVEPTSSGNTFKSSAQFAIPNTLSQKYNIYCVFVPTTIVDTTDTRPSKVKFYLTYVNSSGVVVSLATIDATNTVQAPNKSSAIFTTDGKAISKVLVAKNFEFPYCNLIGNRDLINGKSAIPSVLLKVENAVASTEISTFNRTMRIDCIILEPVQ